VVFRSLGIEFQFFPLLVAPESAVRFGFLGLLLLASPLIRDEALVFHYLPLFVAGILAFQSKAGLISTRALLKGLSALAISGPIACLGMVTALIIWFVGIRSSRLTRLGAISYSLYLLHVPIGGKIMNLGGRFAHNTAGIATLLLVALGASLGAAAIFYRWLELPFPTGVRFDWLQA
jgi:peptidoglycan/LPS O-acetylase OafA/YrhL